MLFSHKLTWVNHVPLDFKTSWLHTDESLIKPAYFFSVLNLLTGSNVRNVQRKQNPARDMKDMR